MSSDWVCSLCNYQHNRDWRKRCRRCEAYRNDAMGRDLGLTRATTLAERQTNQQRAAAQQHQQQKRKDDAERRRLKEEVEKLRELVAARSSTSANAVGGDAEEGGDEMDESAPYSTWSEEDRNKRLELAKGGLAYAIETQGEDSDQAAKCRSEIAALQRASREAKPFKAHRAQLERRLERLKAQKERDEEAIETAQEEIKQLQEKVESLQAAVAERTKSMAEVSEELKTIVKKALDEEIDGEAASKPPWAQEENPWKAMSAAITGLAGQPGVPAEFAVLLQHVQQFTATLAAQQQQTPAPNQPPPPSSSTGSSTGAAGRPGKPTLSAPASPAALAPHAKAAAPPPEEPIATTGQKAASALAAAPAAQPPTPTAGNGTEGSAPKTDAGDALDDSKATDGVNQGAGPAVGAGVGESEPELVDDDANEESAMSVDLEGSLALLPEDHRRRVRAAIRRGRFRTAGRPEGETTDSRREDRERSPRPGRNGDGGEL